MNTIFLYSILLGLGLVGIGFSIRSAVSPNLTTRVMPGVLKPRGATSGNYFSMPSIFKKMAVETRKQSKSRLDTAAFELPDLIEFLAVCLEAGDNTYGALKKLVDRSTGEVSKEIAKIIRKVDFGGALATEIHSLADRIPHPQVAEFASKISLSLTRGTPLAEMFHDQSQSLRQEIKSRLLKQVGKNETRMLIPLVFLILPVTVLFAIYPSLKLLNFNYL